MTQQPNTRLFILPFTHLVYVYQIGQSNYDSAKLLAEKEAIIEKYDRKIRKARKGKKQRRLMLRKQDKLEEKELVIEKGNRFMRWGEELAVFDSADILESQNNLKQFLHSKGFFEAQVNYRIKRKDEKKLTVIYKIIEEAPYTIDSLILSVKDKQVAQLYQANTSKYPLLNKQYDVSLFDQERTRVYEMMTNNGYYDFKRQFVLFEVDSVTLGENKLIVRETIANPPGQNYHKPHRIDSVIFTSESGLVNAGIRRTTTYKDITYNFTQNKYSEKLLAWRIFLEKDSLYSKKLTLETQRQLSYLDIFKFVNINYDSTDGRFVANIFTSPLKKYQTSTEVGLSYLEQAQGLPGPFLNFNAKSRNIFGGLEIIQFDGSAGIQGLSGVSDEETNYSRRQVGGQLSLTIPQFLFPLKSSVKDRIGQYNPRTKIATGVNFEDRRSEYLRNTFNANMSYIWQVEQNSQFIFKPFDLSYIFTDPTDQFEDLLEDLEDDGFISLVSAFRSSFVSFSSIGGNININNYGTGNRTSSLYQGYFETGGNLQHIFGDQPFGAGDDLEFYQYLKTSLDLRFTQRVSRKANMAYLFRVGAAYAYADNRALPYEKYFFAGGSNSIRAWQPRRLGPGAYAQPDSENPDQIDYSFERPGDIILETSMELRRDLIGFVDFALFIDAGNVWLWNSETVDSSLDEQNDNGVFKLDSFLREIAVGSGFGLRFDFSFLILRLDMAYKIIDPAYPLGDRFLLDDYRFSDIGDIGGKAAINIGIGYPF